MKGYFYHLSDSFDPNWYYNIEPTIDYFRYLDELNICKIKLSKSAYFTLFQFINIRDILSTDDLYEILREMPFFSIDYKNILKKIKRFESDGLIQKTKSEKMP
ncbi:MAG: hypothetical protein ACPKPY_01020, partial [Nitrososphaeraceae archaeon]